MQKSTTVLTVALRDLEAELRHAESWPQFIPELDSVERTAAGRYAFTVRRDGLLQRVRVLVRRSPRGNGLLWTATDGPAWNGHLYLQAVDEQRTRVNLELHVAPGSILGQVVGMVGAGDTRAQMGLYRLQDMVQAHPLRAAV